MKKISREEFSKAPAYYMRLAQSDRSVGVEDDKGHLDFVIGISPDATMPPFDEEEMAKLRDFGYKVD
jgi:hypothetical protein